MRNEVRDEARVEVGVGTSGASAFVRLGVGPLLGTVILDQLSGTSRTASGSTGTWPNTNSV